jgi:hypothetical protein
LFAVALGVGLISSTSAQFKEGQPDPGGAKIAESQVQRWKAGMIVKALGGECKGIVGYAPVPVDWPEQTVRIVAEDITPSAKVAYREVDGTVKLMVVTIRSLRAGDEARALVTFECRRSAILPPDNTDQFLLPDAKDLDPKIRQYLAPSPKIESTDRQIRQLANEIGADKEKAWEKVEAIYDWVRANVQYKDGPIKGALAALRDKTGDCEELTSLFIAICRAAGVPARTVWVDGHCYPEFYLVDKEGKGHWFPCQAAGSRDFGGIAEHRPVLQKGDNYQPPWNRREHQRYLAEHLTGAGGRPSVEFVRKKVTE